MYKLSIKLVRENQSIAIEDLRIGNMLKNLGLRNWICLNCNAEHDRDINVSKNLEKLIA